MRIGIVGAGSFARRVHIPNLKALDGVEIVAACRRDQAKLVALCDEFGIPSRYDDYRQMLAKEDLDGVVIATPHDQHFQQCVDALDAGLGVLVEKPMVLTNVESRDLVRKVDETGLPFVVGYNRRWNPAFRKAREMVSTGKIGRVRALFGHFTADVLWLLKRTDPPEDIRSRYQWDPGDPPNFRGTWDESGGGMFVDGGTHLVDSALWVVGAVPVEVTAYMDSGECETDVNTVALLRFEDGAVGSFNVVGCSRCLPDKRVYVTGETGVLSVDDGSLTWENNPGETQSEEDFESTGNAASHFVDVLKGDAMSECTVRDGARAVAAVSAIYESAREGRAVKVDRSAFE